MAETIKNKFRYVLTDDRGSIVAEPLNENNIKVSDQFNEDDDERRTEYVRTISGDIIFINEAYQWLLEREQSGARCDNIVLTLERQDCYNTWQLFARGYVPLSAGKWNLDNCQMTVTPDRFYPYQCLDDFLDTELNMLEMVRDKAVVSLIDPVITIEKLQCGPWTETHEINPAGNIYPCDLSVNVPPVCFDANQGWGLYYYFRRLIFALDTTQCYWVARWAREVMTLPTGQTPDLTAGWILVGGGTAPGTQKWARPARTFGKQSDDFIQDTHFGPENPNNPLITSRIQWAVDWWQIYGDTAPENFGGVVQQEGSTQFDPIIYTGGNNSRIRNGVLLSDFIKTYVSTACPNVVVTSAFFNINSPAQPTDLMRNYPQVDVNIVFLTGNGITDTYQFVITGFVQSVSPNVKQDDFIFWQGKFYRINGVVGSSYNSLTLNIYSSEQEPIAIGSFSGVSISLYFGIGGRKNYVTGEPSYTNNLILFDQSDVKRPNAQNVATISNVSLGQVLTAICKMCNCEWWIDAGTLHIEHVSFRSNEVGLTLTPEQYPTIKGMRQYSYDRSKLPRLETFSFEVQANKDFVGYPIVYDNGCSTRERSQQEKKYPVEASTDLQAIMNGGDNVSESGLVIVAAKVSSNGVYYVGSRTPIIDTVEMPNNLLGWANLHTDFWLHDRPFKRGVMNNRNTLFRSVKPTKIGVNLRIPICCDIWFNPKQKIVAPLGLGTVRQADYNLGDNTLELQLTYDATTADTEAGRPYANNDVMYALSGGVWTYWHIAPNDQDPASGINPESIVIVDPPALGTVEVVTYNGVPGFIRYMVPQNVVGDDVFTYTIANRAGVRSDPGFVIVNLLANVDPDAIDDYYTMVGNETLSISSPGVMANDILPNDAEVNNAGTFNTAHGVITMNRNGSFTYKPTTGYSGPDSFVYTVIDQLGRTASASMFFTINPPLYIRVQATELPPLSGNPLHKTRFTFTMVNGGPFTKTWSIRFGGCNTGGYCNGYPGASNPGLYLDVTGLQGQTSVSIDSTWNNGTNQYTYLMVIFQMSGITSSQISVHPDSNLNIQYQ